MEWFFIPGIVLAFLWMIAVFVMNVLNFEDEGLKVNLVKCVIIALPVIGWFYLIKGL